MPEIDALPVNECPTGNAHADAALHKTTLPDKEVVETSSSDSLANDSRSIVDQAEHKNKLSMPTQTLPATTDVAVLATTTAKTQVSHEDLLHTIQRNGL